MKVEIERKFLVEESPLWRAHVVRSTPILQGYFRMGEGAGGSVRVRIAGDSANLNLKSSSEGCSRQEFEYTIPVEDAHELLKRFCQGRTVEKIRHFVPAAEPGLTWEIDEYLGPFQGHFTAELEIPSEEFAFRMPSWLGEEKTADRRFRNAALASAQCWPDA